MCYDVRQMSDRSATTAKVGVRELRQNLSVYLRRIHRGERFEVTDRGNSVALLLPLPNTLSPLERLVAEGRARPPKGNPLDLPPPDGPPTTAVSEALRQERADRL